MSLIGPFWETLFFHRQNKIALVSFDRAIFGATKCLHGFEPRLTELITFFRVERASGYFCGSNGLTSGLSELFGVKKKSIRLFGPMSHFHS